MKIKAVCEATGLTDRAVRYYIEEGLIEPDFTENYLGRRNYEFDEEDVRALKRVAKLRSYDFSVAEIGCMIRSPEKIGLVCDDLIARKREKLEEDEQILAALEKLPKLRPSSVEELVDALDKPAAAVPPDRKKTKLLPAIGKTVLATLIFSPFVLVQLMFFLRLIEFRFVKFDLKFLLIMLACLVPSLLALILPKRIPSQGWRTALRVILGLLCGAAIFVIVSFGFIYWNSGGTDNISDYGVPDWGANWPLKDEMYQGLFPTREEFFGEGSEPELYHFYALNDVFGSTIEIDAERRIEADLMEEEVSRRKLAFSEYYEKHAEKWRVYWGGHGAKGEIVLKYAEFTRGRFSCFAFYTNAEPFEIYRSSRSIYLFAYDPEDCTVRYAFYNCTDVSNDLPYFTSLDWGIG